MVKKWSNLERERLAKDLGFFHGKQTQTTNLPSGLSITPLKISQECSALSCKHQGLCSALPNSPLVCCFGSLSPNFPFWITERLIVILSRNPFSHRDPSPPEEGCARSTRCDHRLPECTGSEFWKLPSSNASVKVFYFQGTLPTKTSVILQSLVDVNIVYFLHWFFSLLLKSLKT